jgi:aryl-alcohol dehydrogenase-like predicted oxidoreductase
MARGRLTRPWQTAPTNRAETDEMDKTLYAQTEQADRAVIDRVAQVAAARGAPMAQVALAWVLSKSVVTAPIIGATKPHHLADAVGALAIKLTPQEIQLLEEPYVPHAVVGYK